LALHACATAPSADQSSSCGPAERAAHGAHTAMGAVGKIYDHCAEDFDLWMCNPVNLLYVLPMETVMITPIVATVYAADDKLGGYCQHEVAPAKPSEETKESVLEAP